MRPLPLLFVSLAWFVLLAEPAAGQRPYSAANQLSEIFIRACLEGRISGDKIIQIDAKNAPKVVRTDMEGASAMRVFSVPTVPETYLVAASLERRSDGVTERCGLFSKGWDVPGAKMAVFFSPLLGRDALAARYKPDPVGRLLQGVWYAPDYSSEVAYGQYGRFTYMMMSAYDRAATERRQTAMEQIDGCRKQAKPKRAACMDAELKRARSVLRSYNGI